MDNIKSTQARRLLQISRMTSAQECQTLRNESVSSDQNGNKYLTNSASPDNSENVPYPLTRDEAIVFIKFTLNIADPEAAMQQNPLELLNNITDQMNKVIPFTNIHFFTSLPIWSWTPAHQKDHMLLRQGGTCLWINPFTKALIDRLGYKAYHICGNNPGDGINDTHISTIVEDVTYPGSRHLVDPGTRRPLCAAIPLDFEKESPTYKFHYMRSKFFKEGDLITWCAQTPMNMADNHLMYDSEGQKWHVQVKYWMNEKRNWYPFLEIWRKFFQIEKAHLSPPFNGLVFFAYLKEKIISVLAFRGKIITYFIEEDSYERVKMTKPQLLKLFQTHFPQYPENNLQEVFQICPLT